MASLSASEALPLIQQYESGGQNTYNYLYASNPNYYTASGLYQITNSTWRGIASAAGIDLGQYPTAISAPADVQTAAATALYNQSGFQPWSGNSKLMAAVSDLTGGTSGTTTDTTGTTGTGSASGTSSTASRSSCGLNPVCWLGALGSFLGGYATRAALILLAIILMLGAIYLFAARTQAVATPAAA